MTLLEEFETKTARDSYPDHEEIAKEIGATFAHYELEDTTRWGTVESYVYQRGEEFVKVTYENGSGDSDIDYDPEFTAVRPVTKTVTVYENA